jgi:hypothetical protein
MEETGRMNSIVDASIYKKLSVSLNNQRWGRHTPLWWLSTPYFPSTFPF